LAEPTCITNFITVFRYLNVYWSPDKRNCEVHLQNTLNMAMIFTFMCFHADFR
jgi:hypothetical protein